MVRSSCLSPYDGYACKRYRRDMTNDSSPVEMLMQVVGGYVLSRCLHVIAELGVADALGDVRQTTQALSGSVGANADALCRTLRLLAANGIFEERDGLIAHTCFITVAQRPSAFDDASGAEAWYPGVLGSVRKPARFTAHRTAGRRRLGGGRVLELPRAARRSEPAVQRTHGR